MSVKGTIARARVKSRRKKREKSEAEIRRLKLAENKALKEAKEKERLAKAKAELEKANARLAKANKQLGGKQGGIKEAIKKVDRVISNIVGVEPGPGLRRKKKKRGKK